MIWPSTNVGLPNTYRRRCSRYCDSLVTTSVLLNRSLHYYNVHEVTNSKQITRNTESNTQYSRKHGGRYHNSTVNGLRQNVIKQTRVVRARTSQTICDLYTRLLTRHRRLIVAAAAATTALTVRYGRRREIDVVRRPTGDVYLIYGRRATRFIETLYSNIRQSFVACSHLSPRRHSCRSRRWPGQRDALTATHCPIGQLVSCWSAGQRRVSQTSTCVHLPLRPAAAAVALLSHPLLSVSTV